MGQTPDFYNNFTTCVVLHLGKRLSQFCWPNRVQEYNFLETRNRNHFVFFNTPATTMKRSIQQASLQSTNYDNDNSPTTTTISTIRRQSCLSSKQRNNNLNNGLNNINNPNRFEIVVSLIVVIPYLVERLAGYLGASLGEAVLVNREWNENFGTSSLMYALLSVAGFCVYSIVIASVCELYSNLASRQPFGFC